MLNKFFKKRWIFLVISIATIVISFSVYTSYSDNINEDNSEEVVDLIKGLNNKHIINVLKVTENEIIYIDDNNENISCKIDDEIVIVQGSFGESFYILDQNGNKVFYLNE